MVGKGYLHITRGAIKNKKKTQELWNREKNKWWTNIETQTSSKHINNQNIHTQDEWGSCGGIKCMKIEDSKQ